MTSLLENWLNLFYYGKVKASKTGERRADSHKERDKERLEFNGAKTYWDGTQARG